MNIKVNYGPITKELYKSISLEQQLESDDYLIAAQETYEKSGVNKRVISCLETALDINPYNSEAKLWLLIIEENKRDIRKDVLKLIKAEVVFLEEVYGITEENSMGMYWGITETRGLIRMYYTMFENALRHDDVNQAVKYSEKILQLNESDNIGMRFDHHKILLKANKYNKLRKFIEVDFFEMVEKYGMTLELDSTQIYAMLVTFAYYQQPKKFNSYLTLLTPSQLKVLHNPTKRFRDKDQQKFAKFICEYDNNLENYNLVVNYLREIN